jgi:regulator of ribonuclease activity B
MNGQWRRKIARRILDLLRTLVRGQLEMSADSDVIAQLTAAGGDLSAPHTILHYIDVRNRESADSIANELRQRGLRIEQRLGADGENCLVLAIHEVIVSEALMGSTRRSMEALIGEIRRWRI